MEAIVQSYAGRPLTAFACDFWNGNDLQCDLFQQTTGISFPVLEMASPLGAPNMYNCSYHYCFVLDGDGVVQYRGAGVNIPALSQVIEEAVNRLEDQNNVGVNDTPAAGASLAPNVPNPFNPATRLPFTVDRDGLSVTIGVYDMRGQLVRTLATGPQPAGRHEVTWNGRDTNGRLMPSGAYVARLRAGGAEQARVMTLVK